jgi:hypothetical protein
MTRFPSTGVKTVFIAVLCFLSAFTLRAQTKILREVAEDISTQVKAISQDNALVGYLSFTRLERADADSFNYRVTVMDENLNDLGTVKFRQEQIGLQSVSFEQNVLCLGYIQSPLNKGESHILLQFIDLTGKVLNSYYKEVTLNTTAYSNRRPSNGLKVKGYLKYGIQIRNIPNSGFAVFYGDDARQQLLTFDLKGGMTHEQPVPASADRFYLHTSANEIFLMTKQDHNAPEGGYSLYLYSAKDLTVENNFDLRDVNGNWLKVLTFDNDPASGDPYIAGCIINPRRDRQFFTPTDYSYTPYLGLFTLDLGNPKKDMYANCSYWFNGAVPGVATDGMFTDQGFYVKYATAFRDFSGNTIFAGTALLGKGFVGAAKYKLADGVFVRQDASGHITLDNNIACDETKYFGPGEVLFDLDKKDFYKVVNADMKSNYMIIDDVDNIYIYNVSARKIMRTIAHKDGNIKINVYPAKEGHMMVTEYNRKEKTTRISIEAL